MDSLGELLRSTREAKGIGLNKAEEDTKIRKKYLQALEEGKYDVLPGRVYTKGFLRIYGKYLGLSEEQVMTDYSHFGPMHSENAAPSVTKIKKTRKPVEIAGSKKTYLISVITAVVAISTLVAYSYISQNAAPSSKSDDKPATAVKGDLHTPDSNSNPKQSSPQAEAPAADNLSNTPPVVTNLELKLVGNVQICWAKIRVDDKVVFEGNIKPGDIKIFSGKVIRVTLGNAGAVEVIQNGNSLGYLGSYGQVIKDREFKIDAPAQ